MVAGWDQSSCLAGWSALWVRQQLVNLDLSPPSSVDHLYINVRLVGWSNHLNHWLGFLAGRHVWSDILSLGSAWSFVLDLCIFWCYSHCLVINRSIGVHKQHEPCCLLADGWRCSCVVDSFAILVKKSETACVLVRIYLRVFLGMGKELFSILWWSSMNKCKCSHWCRSQYSTSLAHNLGDVEICEVDWCPYYWVSAVSVAR